MRIIDMPRKQVIEECEDITEWIKSLPPTLGRPDVANALILTEILATLRVMLRSFANHDS